MGGVIRIFTTEDTESTETGEERVFGSWIRTPSASVPAVFSALSVSSVVNLFFALVCAGCAARTSTTANRGGAVATPATVPSGAAAKSYATEGIASVTTELLANQLAEEVAASRRRLGRAPILRDGRLDLVATDIAFATDAVRAPSPDAVAFLLSHYGLVEPDPNLFLVHGDDGAEVSAAEALRGQLVSAAALVWRRVGIGIRRTSGKWSAVLVFQEKNFDIEPIPRRLASGGHLSIAGKIRPTLHSPEVLFTPPRGEVERIATSAKHDTFAARFDCNRGDGAYQVEITAADARGPRVLANFPLYCGVAPPTMFTAVESTATPTIDPALAEAQLLEQLDRDRKTHGLPALVHDPRLAQIARRYSREMAETGEVAHYSRHTGSIIDRVAAAGISPAPTFIAENVSSALSPADAERGFMASPGHRDNILHRSLTHVGVGVAIGREEAGMVSLYFTQIFAGWGQ
jgi:uncharacterized protein YkwD